MSDPWACPLCTFENDHDEAKCVICEEGERPPPGSAAANAASREDLPARRAREEQFILSKIQQDGDPLLKRAMDLSERASEKEGRGDAEGAKADLMAAVELILSAEDPGNRDPDTQKKRGDLAGQLLVRAEGIPDAPTAEAGAGAAGGAGGRGGAGGLIGRIFTLVMPGVAPGTIEGGFSSEEGSSMLRWRDNGGNDWQQMDTSSPN